MSNLFNESDFALFELYVGRKPSDEGHKKLKEVYYKLGSVITELKRRGYPARIKRNPQNRGGKYSEYHWSQIYPMDKELFQEIGKKMFVVLGTSEKGFIYILGLDLMRLKMILLILKL